MLNIERSAEVNLPPLFWAVLRVSATVASPNRVVVAINTAHFVSTPADRRLRGRPTQGNVDTIRTVAGVCDNWLADRHDLQLTNCDVLVVVDHGNVSAAIVARCLVRLA
jgi:hypothetical protein